jgi:hypothetical protein
MAKSSEAVLRINYLPVVTNVADLKYIRLVQNIYVWFKYIDEVLTLKPALRCQ